LISKAILTLSGLIAGHSGELVISMGLSIGSGVGSTLGSGAGVFFFD
jgi:hypothetical protein